MQTCRKTILGYDTEFILVLRKEGLLVNSARPLADNKAHNRGKDPISCHGYEYIPVWQRRNDFDPPRRLREVLTLTRRSPCAVIPKITRLYVHLAAQSPYPDFGPTDVPNPEI